VAAEHGSSDLSARARDDLQKLGAALELRGDDVLRRTSLRTAGAELSSELLSSFEQFNRRSTASLGRWLAGESDAVAKDAGKDTWQFYGEMAARHELALNEIIRRCLAWRDAVAETMRELADEIGSSPAALERALQTLQFSLEYSLVRIAKSIDAERQRTHGELAFITTHDPLTGLPNQSLIIDRTEQLLLRARRHKTPVAALIVRLENLEALNETLGRDSGDELLRAAAERLDGCVRDTDALGRVGEGEFAVVVEGDEVGGGPTALAERISEALLEPFALAGHAGGVTLSSCIGVAVGARTSAEALIRDADLAMRHARCEGGHGLAVFERGMERAMEQRRALEIDVRDALARGELKLAYQPIVALSDMGVIGVEALLRWTHPILGPVSPTTLIPLLEEHDLIVEVGGWVLHEACRFAAATRGRRRPVSTSVNISGRQLDNDELLSHVRRALGATGLDARALTLEITETTLMRNVEVALRTLCSLRDLGVRIAIDDFGTGYSSLSHLQQFPVDELKIDRSFVGRLDGNDADPTLVRTMLQLGRELSIRTVAEGIETPGQLAALREAGCDHGQGFLFARPLDAAATRAVLGAGTLSGAATTASA
jgi:diguanylate cyclase (GGDEF)-like protein